MDSRYLVSLNGKMHPVYACVLDLAHERGLQSIVTELIQIPSEENGNTAITKATVTMKDGSVFTEYGDANVKNVNPRIANAIIRMSATRAKGRALRDAVNIGEALAEEIPDEPADLPDCPSGAREAPKPAAVWSTPPGDNCTAPNECHTCGMTLTQGRSAYFAHKQETPLCGACEKKERP